MAYLTQGDRRAPVDHGSLSPSAAIKVIGVGHAAWGLVAYRHELREWVGAGLLDSVGDGLFSREHSADGRAAAFWFLLAAPLIILSGRLVEAAEAADDHRALGAAGATVLGIGAVGAAVMPRSGFPIVAPTGLWLLRRSLSGRPGRP